MEELCKSRCGMCGAEMAARHLGSVKIGDADVAVGYCEWCNEFAVPIGEDEKPYRERMAEAKSRVPKGWSRRQCEDGSLELRHGAPWRWLWAFPVGFVVLVAMTWIDFAISWDPQGTSLVCTIIFCATLLTWLVALYRLNAQRYRLGRDALVVESLWLGFLPMCRRKFVRSAITSGGIEERGKDFFAVWSNGYDKHAFWRGRSKDEADFIDANLLALGDALLAEPLLCEKCGGAFCPDDIDMRSNSLTCLQCGAATDPGKADYARLIRFRMRYRPRGVVDIAGGFEYREGRWWSGALKTALSHVTSTFLFALVALRFIFELISHEELVPFVLLALFLGAVVYLLTAMLVGRFGVHRIASQDGRIAYFHGISGFGRRVELPTESMGDIGVTYRGSLIDNSAAIPNAIAIAVTGKNKVCRIFRDCPPIFYHWAEGWLHEMRKTAIEDAQ